MRVRRAGLGLVVLIAAVALVWALRGQEAPAGDGAEVKPAVGVATRTAEAGSGGVATTRALADAGARPSSQPKGSVGGAQVVATFGWGSGADALGRSRPQEGNPEGPMSLAVDGRGTTWIVDQQNGRLVRVARDGSSLGTVPLPVQAAQDVVVAKDGTAVVMDRLADKSLALIGPDGQPKGELHLLGKGMPEGGASTGVFTDGTDVLVEREHGDTVRVGTTGGKNDLERPELPGRPGRDGKALLTANIANASQGLVIVDAIDRPSLEHRFARQVKVGPSVVSVLLLDADQSGVIYLGALVTTATGYETAVLCLDPLDGRLLGRVTLPANGGADESFRQLAVSDDGEVLFLYRTEESAQLLRTRCP